MNATTDARLRELQSALQRGDAVMDRDFDRLYPHQARALSRAFWTPVRVAQRAVQLLFASETASEGASRNESRSPRVLDVGAGVGKFCIVAAAMTGVEVTGIEHRENLVAIARATALRLGVRARFLHGDLAAADWGAFDAFYFYNPFFENVHVDNHIDERVELSARRFAADRGAAIGLLGRARPGTRVVTYHGLGAELPSTYRLLANESAGSDMLKLWVKQTEAECTGVVAAP
jgi:predicted RNA methylase